MKTKSSKFSSIKLNSMQHFTYLSLHKFVKQLKLYTGHQHGHLGMCLVQLPGETPGDRCVTQTG